MENKHLDELFEDVNKVVRQTRSLYQDNFDAGIVDTITSDCDHLLNSYEKLLAFIEYEFESEYKVEREMGTETWNITQLEDLYADINNWKITDDLYLNESDTEWFQGLKNTFVRYLEYLINTLHGKSNV